MGAPEVVRNRSGWSTRFHRAFDQSPVPATSEKKILRTERLTCPGAMDPFSRRTSLDDRATDPSIFARGTDAEAACCWDRMASAALAFIKSGQFLKLLPSGNCV
jgi:hypothetical protein